MSFISKMIPGKKFLVVDVGSYKVKVAFCECKNSQIKIISYGEKKQERSDIENNEIVNIEGVSNTIEIAILRALKGQNYNPKDIIINIPSSDIVSCVNKITYQREQKQENISLDELDFIIGKIEKKAILTAKQEISKKTGYSEIDLKLITSSINQITIDGQKVVNPVGFTGENIDMSTLNIFIPNSKYSIIKTIANYLNKNILSIIPTEFSLPKILEKTDYAYDDVLFLDIGNAKTSVIIQKKGVIIGFNTIEIGINGLIKTIKNNYGLPNLEIIKKIDEKDSFLKEKKEFLSVLEEGIILAIKEIVDFGLIPYNIFISGGGDNNFVRESLKSIDFSKYSIHSIKPITFLNFDLKQDLEINGDNSIFNKTNLGLLSMIITSKEIINYKSNPIFSILKEFIEKNEI